jgi:hypothetical protein
VRDAHAFDLLACVALMPRRAVPAPSAADGYRGSVKMHKDRGGPLVMGPIWDLNEAFGLCCGFPIDGKLHLQFVRVLSCNSCSKSLLTG